MKYLSAILFVICSLWSLEFVASRGIMQGCCNGTDGAALNTTCEPCPAKNATVDSVSNDTEKAKAIQIKNDNIETVTKKSRAIQFPDSEALNETTTEKSNATGNGTTAASGHNGTIIKTDSEHGNLPMTESSIIRISMNMSNVELMPENMSLKESNITRINTTLVNDDSKPDNMRMDKSIGMSDADSKPDNLSTNQSNSNATSEGGSKLENTTKVESNDMGKADDSKANNMTIVESNTTKIHMPMSLVDAKLDNMTMENDTEAESNVTMDNHNSTMDNMSVEELNSTNSNTTDDTNSMSKANFTSENTTMEELQDCESNDTVSCFEHGCLSETDFCHGTFDCSNLNKSAICGEANMTMRQSKKQELSPLPLGHNEISENELSSEKSNLIKYDEPEEENFINGSTAGEAHEGESQATKESLKEAEPAADGAYNLKIIIPVVVVVGLCLVVLIIWFVTKRSKEVDSYALQ